MASPARRIAADVLLRVEQGGAFANLALDGALRAAGVLEPREAALATELVYGTLRWRLALERALAKHGDRAVDTLDAPVRTALLIGAFELVFHPRVPERAAVNEAVELAKDLKAQKASGYVNAVLRRLASKRELPAPPDVQVDPAGHLAAISAHPRWLCERWIAWLGFEEAKLLCLANQVQARASVRVNRRRATIAQAQQALFESGLQCEPGLLSPDALILQEGSPPALDLEGHTQGLFQAQDEAAQLVSLFAAPTEGMKVLDACAAPGGKSCHLAELVGPTGSVLALDLHARKAKGIEEAARRLGHANLTARAADASLPLPDLAHEAFDLLLLDAPCSGLGTLRRHPEVRLKRTSEDIDRLSNLQRRLLDNLAAYVKPGGVLVYALCTLTAEECDEVPRRFLEAHPEFTPEAPPAHWAHDDAAAHQLDGARLRTLPSHAKTDGFFALRLRKKANTP
ncbi:MAG: 16S rRNA (cytosine(967)-C(5))-methyltransferase RsmB [Deltaproteobacteria bacterium]|nr:16S rRNA (cytosine(967)-C(5))-methyltransferase RsmB [Deltaproteobacteria bacterium]